MFIFSPLHTRNLLKYDANCTYIKRFSELDIQRRISNTSQHLTFSDNTSYLILRTHHDIHYIMNDLIKAYVVFLFYAGHISS